MTREHVPDEHISDDSVAIEETFEDATDYYRDAKGVIDDQYRLETKSGFSVELRPESGRSVPDREVVHEVLIEGVYDRPEFTLEPGMTVFDIGAHIGTFSMHCASRIEDGAVISCEPHPENYEQLRRNVQQNDFDSIYPNHAACAAESGTVELSSSSENTGGHSTEYSTASDARIEVPAVTIPDLMDEYGVSSIDLLKIDAEGAEYEILFGLSEATFSSIDRIVLEEHRVPETESRYEDDALRAHLEARGYDVSKTNEVEYADEGRFWVLCATKSD